MATPDNHFRVSLPEPIEGAPDSLVRKTVSLETADYPGLRFHWHYTIRNGSQIDGPHGFGIEPSRGTPSNNWQTLNATTIRDLPLSKLERAARQALGLPMLNPDAVQSGTWLRAAPPQDIPGLARETVRNRHPEVDPEAGPAAARRWKRLIRLAEVWLEYQAAEASGDRAPTNTIAEARGVAPATVRGWIHHARREGLDTSPGEFWKAEEQS
ncbi:hypothetical protein AB0K88_24200 [Streptomyces werraensis]|uniref:hypothetical protein n=1 Tax=Streptomyces werraensis TaxID=68284 RepID=UPI003432FE57